ncbi:FGGY-family carbohydrate kinase [Eubacterium barkeri]|uniref:Ribulokinase n=1 Tax=Eubacterium barkeri TaxID=1528 RepID=A0A1H3JLM1_EUBBA|nr:FGGY-family carbohydrate kinase [Eubacterium barkeri]SDY40787.1 ribulokinase [Eubacterium barkeri]
MEKSYFIGVDIGTQGVRVGISDESGKLVTIHDVSYETKHPQFGWAEQNPDDWWNGFVTSLNACLEDCSTDIVGKIKTLGVCGTSSTVLAMDAMGNAMGQALLWMDSRAKKQARIINETKHDVLKYCGGEVSVEWMIPKTLWIKENMPEIYEAAFKIVEDIDYFNYRLTGVCCASINQATCKWNYVDDCGGWNQEFFNMIGLDDYKEKIPTDIKRVGEVIGTILPGMADILGLPKDIKIIQGATDACQATYGNGVIEPGQLATIMGTSFVHQAVCQEPIFQDGIWGPFNKALTDDFWMLEGGQISAGSITKWFVKEFNINRPDAYAYLAEEASKIPIGSDGVIVLDFFQGNRTPYKNANLKGNIFGLTLKHSQFHIYRAILEGIAFGMKNILDNFKNQGYEINTIVGSGGVTKNPVWLQIIADVTGAKVVINECTDAGVLGHCVLGAVTAGVYGDLKEAVDHMVHSKSIVEPNLENTKKYQKVFDRYIRLYESLKDIMNEEDVL